jgi:hypothetical protein
MNSAATRWTIDEIRKQLRGEPVFLAGSLVAADVHGLAGAFSDVDLFCPTGNVLISTGQKLLGLGYKFDDRFDRVWHRWLRYGFKTWHTNSLRLTSPAGIETNLVYKLTDGHATTSLAQVIESFDFGLLGAGWDLESDTFRDMRPYLFPQWTGLDPMAALPMMPNKADSWAGGFISQYNGLREIGRYAKYVGYGYDMSLVKNQLVQGYRMADLYLSNHFDTEKQQLGQIYSAIAAHMELDHVDELRLAAKTIDYKDGLDVIMEALE